MNIEKSKGPDLLSEKYDAEALGDAIDYFLRATETLTEELSRTLYWAMRLMIETISGQKFARTVPGFRYTAYGFLDPEYEQDAFGIIIFAAPSIFSEEVPQYELPSCFEVDGWEFPVVVRRVIERNHQFGSHPSGGTGVCWARSRVSGEAIGPGILTSKHVVGNVLGTPISLSCGCPGQVGDVGPDGIDAAIVVSPCSQATPRRLYPRQLVPPWLDVEFSGATSGTYYTKVTSVTDTKGILTSAHLPSRIFLAAPGRPGDSGALVRETNSGDPIGIYMGEYSDPAGQRGGIAQHVYQATELMDMELFL